MGICDGPNRLHILFLAVFFLRKNLVITLVLSGRAGGAFLVNFLINLFADSIFSQNIQPAFFKFHTWFLQGLCFHVMPCSFQLVPNFFVKNAFFGDRYLCIFIFSQISVYFHNSKAIQGIWMDLYRDVDSDDQARCTQVA